MTEHSYGEWTRIRDEIISIRRKRNARKSLHGIFNNCALTIGLTGIVCFRRALCRDKRMQDCGDFPQWHSLHVPANNAIGNTIMVSMLTAIIDCHCVPVQLAEVC